VVGTQDNYLKYVYPIMRNEVCNENKSIY